jgi:hypothetical protein
VLQLSRSTNFCFYVQLPFYLNRQLQHEPRLPSREEPTHPKAIKNVGQLRKLFEKHMYVYPKKKSL